MDQALIVFAKRPQPGRVKTRLTPQLEPDEAATLYRAFLYDALDQYAALSACVRLYLASPIDAALEINPTGIEQFSQVGSSLGERMKRAFSETLEAGYQRAIIIGTDHPTLPSPFIEHAFAALARPASIVLGPSTDGGYYLLGMNAYYPHLFEDMTYSHGDVFANTLERAARTEAFLTILPVWYDVDEPGDLRRLADDLKSHPDQAPRTHAALTALQQSLDPAS